MDSIVPSDQNLNEITECLSQIIELCGDPNHDSQEFWTTRNLWRMLCHFEGKQNLRRLKAIKTINQDKNLHPIADLTRPMIQTVFTIGYIDGDSGKLARYAEWQLHDYYHRILKPIADNPLTPPEIRVRNQDNMDEVRATLGNRFDESRPSNQWKSMPELIATVFPGEHQENKRGVIYLIAGRNTSRSLHNAWLQVINPEDNYDHAKVFFALLAQQMADISIRHKLIEKRDQEKADRILWLYPHPAF